MNKEENIVRLKDNRYPGRGIIVGQTADARHYVQIYWLTGRSENSKNRVFVAENGFVKTEAFDPEKMTDPSLIIYYPIKSLRGYHIVSNGDQTDTIFQVLSLGGSFEDAIQSRTFEPDKPNYTPRISGIMDVDAKEAGYKLSIIKTHENNPEFCQRHFFAYQRAIPGVGHCIHTYAGEGAPLPSFSGEPFVVELGNDMNELADYYWNILHPDTRISLLVKFIDSEEKHATFKIINVNK